MTYAYNISWFISYEHTNSKLRFSFDFFLLQLDYEDFNGRLSVLIFLQNLFNDLTKQRLNDYAAYFFLPIACHYYNEMNNECIKQFQLTLKFLLEKWKNNFEMIFWKKKLFTTEFLTQKKLVFSSFFFR